MMRVDYKAFGKRLREYRLARHLTQEQLGELSASVISTSACWSAANVRRVWKC